MSKNKISNFTEYIDDYDNGDQLAINHGTTDIAFSANIIAAGGIIISPFKNLRYGQNIEFELLNKYVGKQYLDNTSTESRTIKPYNINDIRLRYSVNIKPFREVAAIIALNNIFDQLYESNGYTFSYVYGEALTTQNYYYPQAGFNWLLGLNFKW